MAVDGINTTGTATSTSTSMSKLAENFDQFLTLLTTQLKNQDPLSPMDSAEFTNQLVQFAGVEQQINTNKNLESLLTLQKSSQVMNALSLMGKKVEITGNTVPLQDKSATFVYTLPKAAAQTVYTITDSSGRTVYTGTGDTEAGRHEYSWNGKSSSGVQLPDGTYSLNVIAVDAAGQQIQASTWTIGKVTGVESSDGGAVLNLGGTLVSMDRLSAVVG
ncbi:MAG: flagellar hook assembly protein FlgD [Rhodospirillales bacterium]|nr:flagellar hook assembly protein FlgD [Rhodospirillales bacterium]